MWIPLNVRLAVDIAAEAALLLQVLTWLFLVQIVKHSYVLTRLNSDTKVGTKKLRISCIRLSQG